MHMNGVLLPGRGGGVGVRVDLQIDNLRAPTHQVLGVAGQRTQGEHVTDNVYAQSILTKF